MQNLIEIDGVVVNKEILREKFFCDLEACKGACCTIESEYGAPVTKEEIKIIERLLPDIWEYLPEKSKHELFNKKFYELKEGETLIKSISNRECVFAFYENGIAKCAIEKAYFDGKVEFRKPVSCHLFPIRVSQFGGDALRYERYEECKPAMVRGIEKNITVAEFCKDAIITAYGEPFYRKLTENIED